MAPATRRSSGLGSNANSPSNLDHILEHFNQFKRKHITQNRDIIKTNALAQLRIKELEEKVLSLEAEQTKSNRDLINVRRRLEQAEKAAVCMRQGWQLVGAGIAALSAVEGFGNVLGSTPPTMTSSTAKETLSSLRQSHSAACFQPSARITLDPNALPGGVARNVARPPEAGLNDVMEEHSADLVTDACASLFRGTDEEQEVTAENVEDEDADSDNGDEGDPVSFSADGEETIRMHSTDSTMGSMSYEASHPVEQGHEDERRGAFASSTVEEIVKASDLHPQPQRLHHAASIDSLSSFADDEEIELSTDDENLNYSIHASSSKRTNGPMPAGTSDASFTRDASSRQQKTSMRKRKSPNSSEDAHQAAECSQSEADLSPNEDGRRSSRRASMRDRKSINYALPKLNTKMRKPDPVDLIPAEKSESGRRSTTTPSSEEGKGDEEHGSAYPSSAEESPRRRGLKGKHEVASTGNLREIRRLHQEQQEKQKLMAYESLDNEAKPKLDSDPLRSPSNGSESPRRRSARSSLRKRRSSSSAQSEGTSAGHAAAEPTSRPQSRIGDSDTSSLFESALDKKEGEKGLCLTMDAEVEAVQENLLNPLKTIRQAEPISLSASPPDPSGALSSDALASTYASFTRSLPMATTGTPLPKTANRNGGQHSNIKALKVAGRLQKATPSNPLGLSNGSKANVLHPLSNGNGKPSVPLGPAGAKGNALRLEGSQQRQHHPSQPRSFSATSSKHAAASNTTNGHHSSPPGGDPTKRNSLHAAMTSNDSGFGFRS